MNKRGTFLVINWAKRKKIKFSNHSFSGTMVSQNGYEHTRSIKEMYWGYRIIDEVRCNEKPVNLSFIPHAMLKLHHKA